MLNALPDDSYPPAIAALNSPIAALDDGASKPFRGLIEDASANPWREINILPRQEPRFVPHFEHAEPISMLRDRDFQELTSWFDRSDMPEIEEDVNRHLLMLFPEPCWEDENFEFLIEHL